METIVTWKTLVTTTVSSFLQHKAPRLGAALAYYAAFSVAPLLIISASISSLFYGANAVEGQLKHELIDFVGNDAAEGIQAMIAAAQKSQHSGMVSSIFGVIALVFGATFVFVELKDSMNTIWGVEPKPGLGIWESVWDSAFAFVMVVVTALLLLVSMILSALISTLGHTIHLPASAWLTDFVVSSTVTTLLFAMMFKYLPDIKVFWKDVWFGAGVTALLFTIGKHLVGLYLANTHVGSAYGAASSILVFLLWTYYSSQILFLGAEFTQVHAQMHGRGVRPFS